MPTSIKLKVLLGRIFMWSKLCFSLLWSQFVVPKKVDDCTNVSIEFIFECRPFILIDTFSVFTFFVRCKPAMLSLISVVLACNFSLNIWLTNHTVNRILTKAYLINLLLPLLIDAETIWKKFVPSLLWLIFATLTLTAWLFSSICFLSVTVSCLSRYIHLFLKLYNFW